MTEENIKGLIEVLRRLSWDIGGPGRYDRAKMIDDLRGTLLAGVWIEEGRRSNE